LRFLAWISEFVKITSDEEILKLLRLGGFRGPNAMTNFQAVRVVAPLFIFIVLMIEIKFVFNVDLPVPLLTFLLILPSSLGFYVPALYVKNRALNRKKAIVRSWPDALDLLLIAVEAGMSTEAAFRKTANDMIRYSKDIAEELSITTAELSYLHDRKQAFSNLAERTDSSEIRATTTALIQSERYGTPLGSSLRILAEESRNLRMREVERKAAGLSPKLTIPMVLFFMPVLIAILVVPTLIKIWGWN
jgi:tight adherence protein C